MCQTKIQSVQHTYQSEQDAPPVFETAAPARRLHRCHFLPARGRVGARLRRYLRIAASYIAGQILTDALDIPLEVRGPVSASFAWVPRFSLADVVTSDAELPADLKGVSIKSTRLRTCRCCPSSSAKRVPVSAGRQLRSCKCPSTLLRFSAAEGAGTHCEMGNRSLLNHQRHLVQRLIEFFNKISSAPWRHAHSRMAAAARTVLSWRLLTFRSSASDMPTCSAIRSTSIQAASAATAISEDRAAVRDQGRTRQRKSHPHGRSPGGSRNRRDRLSIQPARDHHPTHGRCFATHPLPRGASAVTGPLPDDRSFAFRRPFNG